MGLGLMFDDTASAFGREGMGSMGLRSASGWQPFDATAPSARRRAVYAARVVNCDATWTDGLGFVAVTGALGAHVRRVECADNVAAEALAVLLAMELGQAGDGRAGRLIFRTDCQAVAIGALSGPKANRNRDLGRLFALIRRTLAHRRQFEVQHVDRAKVWASHALAGRARKAYVRGVAGSAVDAPLWAPTQ